jgi:cytochrome c-type biogenesis protein CcmH/NrfF
MRALALAAAVATLAVASPAAGASPHPRASFNDVEGALMCDTCNVPLAVADSPRADQERREIKQLIAQGLTRRQILDRFKAEYGPDVLALPQGHGFSLAAYVVPVAVVAALIALLALLLPRWRRRTRRPEAEPAPAGEQTITLADSRRLDEDLARYDV